MSKVNLSERFTFPTARFIWQLKDQTIRTPRQSCESVDESNRSATGKATRDQMDEVDVGCIITNVHAHSDQMAHWVNAQLNDPEMKIEVVSRFISSL